jgi:hypothetical protein
MNSARKYYTKIDVGAGVIIFMLIVSIDLIVQHEKVPKADVCDGGALLSFTKSNLAIPSSQLLEQHLVGGGEVLFVGESAWY